MDYCAVYKVVLTLSWAGCITGQFTSLFGPQQGAQNSANDLLQQTLRSQANLLANMGMSQTSNPALDMLMSGLNAQRQTPASPSTNHVWPNMVPVDELLRQQRNVHTSLLQDILNTGMRAQNSPAQSGSDTSGTSRTVETGPQGPFDSVRVVMFNNGQKTVDATSNNGRSPNVQSGFSSSFTSNPNPNQFFENFLSGFTSSSNGASGSGFDNSAGGPSSGFDISAGGPSSGFDISAGVPATGFEISAGNPTSGFDNSAGVQTSGFDNSAGVTGSGFVGSNVVSGSSFDNRGGSPVTGFETSAGVSRSSTAPPISYETPSTTMPPNIVVVTQPPPVVVQGPLSPAPPSPPRHQQPALTCSEEFRQIPGHTLCMEDSPGVTYTGVSIDDTQLITQFHNKLRASVQPPASDLLKLHWDNRLAAVAEKWAKQCTLAHDKERSIPELGLSVGQNVAVGYDTWQIAIQKWYDEIRMYRYGFEPDSYLGPEGWREVAHFTQIVQNGTYLIGCGYAECPHTEYIRFYVCNYAAGQSDLAYPYTAGTQCGSCPNNCVNGLCDCGNLVCRNKGKLDPGTCTCECPRPYKGKACEIVDCPSQDNWICGRDWPKSYCDRYFNVPEECPHMCGLCGGTKGHAEKSPIVVPVPVKPVVVNTTFTSAFGCKYTGKRDTQQACQQYGDKGADMRMCASEGGNVGCSQCDRYFNIKKDYCPVMCGLCDPPCNGKKCLNGGTLDTASCTCQCRPPFTGDICQLAQCPVNGDPRFCKYWPVRYCDMYHNVPEECPVKCGICTDRTDPAATNREA